MTRDLRSDPLDDPSVVDPNVVATQLGVDPTTGLSEQEAARRLAVDGPNELRGKKPVPVWRKVLAQFQDPLTCCWRLPSSRWRPGWWTARTARRSTPW